MSADTPSLQLVERLFAPISTAEHARALTRDIGAGLVLLAPIQVALALAGGRNALVDAGLFALTGILLRITASRWAAATALAVTAGSTLLAIGFHVDRSHASGGRSVLLALVAIWLAGRGLVAVLALHRLRAVPRPGAETNDTTGARPNTLDGIHSGDAARSTGATASTSENTASPRAKRLRK